MMRRASSFSATKVTKDAEKLFAKKVQNKLTHKAKTTQMMKNKSNNREETKIPVEKLKFAVLDTVFVVGINQVGIVGFIGPTLFSEGIWVGIELLNGSFGKNDGSVLGQRYFECKPSHGIFVRPNYCTKIDSVAINTNHQSHSNANGHAIPTAPHYTINSPSSSSEYHVESARSLDSGNGGGFRAMWVAAESHQHNNLHLPPPRIKSPPAAAAVPAAVDNSRVEPVGYDMNTSSSLRNSPTMRSSPSLSFIPPPRKVTVEVTVPPSPSKGSGNVNGNHTANFIDPSSTSTDIIIEKMMESAAFAKKIQVYVDRAVEKSLVPSLDTISHHINQRFISLESLVEAIGSAVAESCDKVDLVMIERQERNNNNNNNSNSNNNSVQADNHFITQHVPEKVTDLSSSGKDPSTPTRLPRSSSSNGLISSQKQHVDECIVIVDALQVAQNNGNSPKHSPKSNRSTGSATDKDDVGGEGGEDQTGDVLVSDPYLEIARLRSALTTVSLLAREAQEEIALERQEMEDQINQLKDQLLTAQHKPPTPPTLH